VLPEALSDAMLRKILIDNPLATYPRLAATAAADRTRAAMREELPP